MYDTLDEMYRLFVVRETNYQENTDIIWSHIKFITDGIINYLDLPVEQVEWNTLDVIGNEMVIMLTIPYNDRFQWVASHETTVQILTIVLPTSVVESYDSDLITGFLNDTEDVRRMDNGKEDYDITPQGVVGFANVTKKVIH